MHYLDIGRCVDIAVSLEPFPSFSTISKLDKISVDEYGFS